MDTLTTVNDDTNPDPATPAQPTWWDLYAALAAHGHTHPDLQPVQVHPSSPGLLHTQPDLVATLELLPRSDRYDATAFADWIDSLDTCHGITAIALTHPSDTMVTALGVLAGIPVALWSVIHATPTRFLDQHGRPVPVTVATVRACDTDVHQRGQLTSDPPERRP